MTHTSGHQCILLARCDFSASKRGDRNSDCHLPSRSRLWDAEPSRWVGFWQGRLGVGRSVKTQGRRRKGSEVDVVCDRWHFSAFNLVEERGVGVRAKEKLNALDASALDGSVESRGAILETNTSQYE